jgi:hypothetical protein
MWRSPAYYLRADQAEQQTPPEDTGRRLSTLERSNGEELRINFAEFKG